MFFAGMLVGRGHHTRMTFVAVLDKKKHVMITLIEKQRPKARRGVHYVNGKYSNAGGERTTEISRLERRCSEMDRIISEISQPLCSTSNLARTPSPIRQQHHHLSPYTPRTRRIGIDQPFRLLTANTEQNGSSHSALAPTWSWASCDRYQDQISKILQNEPLSSK